MSYDESKLRQRFAPTPTHGAAYAVAINAIGGWAVIGACSSEQRYRELRAKLDDLLAFAKGLNDPAVLDAYQYGIAKVDADLRSRMDVIENARKVNAAMAILPQPKAPS